MADLANKPFLSLPEFCKYTGLSRSAFYQLKKIGKLRPTKILDKVVVTRAELERFLASIEPDAAEGEAA